MTLLVFLAAPTVAQIIAPWRGDGAYRFNAWADRFPELAQVVHGPDGFSESVDSYVAACWRRATYWPVTFETNGNVDGCRMDCTDKSMSSPGQ